MVFGAGIFLTGQMYHYTMNNVFAFIVWGLAAFLLYTSRPNIMIYLTGLAIVTTGTIYGLSNMHAFDWWLFALFIVAYGSVVWTQKRLMISYIFSIAYLIQLLGFTLDQLNEFYWFGLFILLLYVVGLIIKTHPISQPFQRVSLLAMFIFVLIQTMLMELSFNPEHHTVYYIVLLLLIILVLLLVITVMIS
ncbi:hypothetical protein [Piscibacillus salipiscarius]|uniref:hypothetical protein n=1 Tax=Piscibacillus salipiscarius TaxID=299480 RepID=UPI0006D0DEE4|nr:hypothetical protein [Piscibacillus salipiscarius]